MDPEEIGAGGIAGVAVFVAAIGVNPWTGGKVRLGAGTTVSCNVGPATVPGAGLNKIKPASTMLRARAPRTTPPINTPQEKKGFKLRIAILYVGKKKNEIDRIK